MIEYLLPTVVAAEERFDDDEAAALFPDESAAVANAVEKRRREFTTVRQCARAALSRLGLPPAPIVPGRRGAPGWPAGVVGSMTHCAGYRAAAVARAEEVFAIGIDAEPDKSLPRGVLESVASKNERRHLSRLAERSPSVSWDRLLFSAKEAMYKAWFPATQQWLDFEDVVATIDPLAGLFTVRLVRHESPSVTSWPASLQGRWLVRRGLVVTTVVVR